MGYRFCHRCGWLSNDEYTYNDNKEAICPVHDMKTSTFRIKKPDAYEDGHKP